MSFASKATLALCSLTSIGIIGYVHFKQQSDLEKLRGGVLRDIEQQQMKKAQNLYVLELQKNLEAKYKEAEALDKTRSSLRSPERQCKLEFKISEGDGPKKIQEARIYLRVAKILGYKLINDVFPDGMSVDVNGRPVAISQEWFGPLDVSGLVRTRVGSTNLIIMKFSPYLTKYYVATIFATRAPRDPEDRDVPSILIDLFFGENQVQPPEITKKRILAYFSKPVGDDVQVENLEVKLECPLTLRRLTHPSMSRKCQHISCFDAMGFLSLQSAVSKCPICGVRCRNEDLLIDGYWVEVLRNIPAHCLKVSLKRDGSWCPVDCSESPPIIIT